MAHNGFQREGYCGLYCGACPKFLASENDTQEDTRCQGCKSAVVAGWCQTCTLKACARNKGLAFCGECDLYPCADLQAFIDDVRYPYHSLVPQDLAAIREKGLEGWLVEQDTRWRCPACGTRHSWHDTTCPQCGGPTRNWAG